jgi:flagellar basal-body rod protein FlgF
MLRGIDTATSGMIAIQRKQDVLTNNLSNAETPGYKQDTSLIRSFPEMLLERIRDDENKTVTPEVGTLSLGVYNQETLPLFTQGILVETNMPFDLAIQDLALPPFIENDKVIKPSAFFAVQATDGSMQLTRNGHFTVNESGQLTTATGELVLGRNGAPISSPELLEGDKVLIKDNGEIIANGDDPTRATLVGNIGLVIVNNPNQLIKTSNGMYQLEGADPAMITNTLPAGVQIKQKALEQSNVDLTQTISSMMTNIRLYEANQKVLQAYDKTLEQLNTIGRV